MNLQYRPLVLPALLAAAALLLAGCSGDDPAKDGTSDLPVGPISQRMSDLEKRFDSDAAAAMNTAMEESVATCMKEQGFDYTPQSQDSDSFTPSEDMPDWGSKEFAQTYGYGITTQRNMPGMAAPATETPDDPQTMDAAYQEALWGTFDESAEDDGGAWLPGGCFGEAMAQIGMDDLMTSTIAQDIDNLSTQADQDDAVVTARDGWASCMADEGYDYTTSEDAQNAFYERFYTDDGELGGDELKTLQDEEIATAVADQKCGTDVEQARATALARLETDYYADHKSEVDAYFAQLEEFLTRS